MPDSPMRASMSPQRMPVSRPEPYYPAMRKALRYRLFGMGKMPNALRAVAGGAGVLVAAEGLPVHNRVLSLRMPGARVSGGVRTASGSVVILPGRLLASIGTHVILDTEFPSGGGRQELALAEDGLRISFDVATVLTEGSGSVEVRYKLPLDQAVLGQLPARGCQVTLVHAAEALLNPWRGSYSGGGSRPAQSR